MPGIEVNAGIRRALSRLLHVPSPCPLDSCCLLRPVPLQVEILAEALNLGDRSGVPRDGVVAIVEQLFPGAIIPGAAPQPPRHCFQARCSALAAWLW